MGIDHLFYISIMGNRVKIFCNENEKSSKVREEVISKLESNGFNIVDEEYEIGVAIGGDGSFLRMVRSANFNSEVFYIGINTGTLGFAQEVSVDNLDDFIYKLKNDMFKVEEISIGEVLVNSKSKEDKYFILNDITVRDKLLNTCKMNICIDDAKFESFAGDGILISTSFGSTAYNLSFGGSIVYNTLHTLQITSIAPLNSKVYSSLINSLVIPQYKDICIKPLNEKRDLIVTIDGENIYYDDVNYINVSLKDKTIKCLREKDYNFISKVNDKFLK